MLKVEYENLNVQPAEHERELEYRLRKGECTRQKLELLNDESANSDVKQQIQDKMRKVERKMKH